MGEKRFLVLDGMRGVAALAVLMEHIGGPTGALVSGGHLAVDFFFALSGFVLAHAYGGSSLSALGFLRVRLVRLYPLYVAGTVLGAIALILVGAGAAQVAGAAAFGVLFLPSPLPFSGIAWDQGWLYPLDPAAWSLFFELIANAVWFPLRRRLSGPPAIVALAVAAGMFVAGCATYGDVGGGGDWSTVWGGFGRAAFSFLAGVLTYGLWRRVSWRPRLPFWAPTAGLIFVLAAPIDRSWFNAPAVMLLMSPLVYLGACCEPAGRLSAAAHRALGDASYGVYTLQFPILIACDAAAQALRAAGLAHPFLLVTPLSIAAVFLAAIWADKAYDRPLRRWLTMRRPSAEPSPAPAAN